ncbi:MULTISPECIES: TonB-dependent receptor [Stenotrophomonas]|jgi:iron complex outermembrane receptor protein|uniref:TonB-dependent receptor n=1 Tax=Stenotrophomonas TaxID=40323 RepID=UPI000304EA10|nr:TonB-dependent receptor [Stenotrophomonas sp. BIO128-Bstrain]WIA61994.1 TonB-dependent receptor [Stenotrophomonas sp. BIO128-Bstrain]
MNRNSNKLRDAVVLALIASAAGTGSAVAQEATGTTNLDRISVTGSRIRQVDVETAQPVLTISRADIQNQGFSSVGDILQNISAAGSPNFSRASPLTSNQEAGGQYIDLRNLGAQRTLVLVNGKRLGISPDGYQDISIIPTSMVERIDVLKDGASSIYGSDAMAGVINIITRKNFDGLEANVYKGQYSQGDGEKETYDFVMGFSGDRGSLTVGAEYHKEEGVWAKDRPFTADTYPDWDPAASLTTVGQWGNWRVGNAGNWQAPNRGGTALGPGQFHSQTSADTSRSSDQMHLLTPLERRSLFVSGNYDITDNVRFTTDLSYTKRESQRQIAGYPLQSSAYGIPMSADSYFNPTGGVADVNWRRRGWEVPRTTDSTLTTWRFAAALEGSFEIGDRFFSWDVGSLYNENDSLLINNGNFYIPAVADAVGPSFQNAAGQIVCGTPGNEIAGCVPWNPFAGFGTGAVANSLDDPNVRNYLFREEHATGKTSTHNYFANLSGTIVPLPAGDLGFAVGYEYRKESGAFNPDAIAQSGDSTNLASGPTKGSYALDEFYLELNIPILADLAFAKELTLDLATRYSDFTSFGDTTNNKFGLKWRPIDDLLVRATYAEGFRAPTIGDLYGGTSQTFPTNFVDPCDSVYGDVRGSARCVQDVGQGYRQLQQGFVPTTGRAAQSPVPFNSGSNPNLTPETSESKTVGFVYSPSYVTGLSVGVDWWSIRIDNTIVTDSPNLIMEDCYVRLIESRCSMFTRDPANGNIVGTLNYGNRNAGYTETEGFDFDISYSRDTDFGRFSAKSSTTYVGKYEEKSTDDADAVPSQNNGFGAYFRVRSNLGLGWSMNDLSVNWNLRYYSGTKESCRFTTRCTLPNYSAPDTLGVISPQTELGAVTFHDVQVSYATPWNATVAVGANNVFNKVGPMMTSQPSSNFSYYGGYDIGRFLYMKYSQKF